MTATSKLTFSADLPAVGAKTTMTYTIRANGDVIVETRPTSPASPEGCPCCPASGRS